MKTSCIRHPDDNVFVIRRDWQLMALETGRKGTVKPKRDNTTECAAEILSVLEYHHNNRMANRMFREVLEKMVKRGKRDVNELGDWMPYSLHYIQELLLNGRSIGLITNSLELLIERKFVAADLPDDLAKRYGGQNRWFRLEVAYINSWIDQNIPKFWKDEMRKSRRKLRQASADAPESPDEEFVGADAVTEPDRKTKEENTVFNFYKHIHAKNQNFVFDSERRSKVRARLNEPHRTLGMAAQAIIGNVVSAYHQAKHENNRTTVYDDIELIFRHAKNFENHIGYAEAKGITEEIALKELEAFVSGQPSRYAKKQAKAPQNASNGTEPASVVVPKNEKQYREFAIAIASFFATNTDNKQIAEFCLTHPSLQRLGDGLIHAGFLTESIIGAIRTYKPEGASAAMMQQIKEFCTTYCTAEALNSTEDKNEE